MSNAEAPISFTTKIGGDLFTVRGDSVAEFVNNLTSVVNDERIVDLIGELQAMSGTAPAVAAVKAGAGGTVTSVSTSEGPTTETDKYGNKFTYGLSDAPTIPDTDLIGVLKEWRSKNGKDLKAFVHPRKGPRPAPEGGDIDWIDWR